MFLQSYFRRTLYLKGEGCELMADIFISYSRKDSKQAISLAERLRAVGMDVWIDQHGLEAATSWSKEIVEAIESSQVFIILLSRSSLLSENVVKELSIASEARRTARAGEDRNRSKLRSCRCQCQCFSWTRKFTGLASPEQGSDCHALHNCFGDWRQCIFPFLRKEEDCVPNGAQNACRPAIRKS
jgi:hypothetical protein